MQHAPDAEDQRVILGQAFDGVADEIHGDAVVVDEDERVDEVTEAGVCGVRVEA